MKYRKFSISILAICATLFLCVIPALAHPPAEMQLAYDFDSQVLDVTITHISPAPTVHYIYRVTINKNGEMYLSQDYESQPTIDAFTYQYPVDTEAGDTLTVTAYCNLYGSVSRTLIVKGEEGDDIDPPTVEITNPQEGYLHFSGVPLLPNPFSFIADTMSPGGFRLRPIQINAEDNIDDTEDLDVTIILNGEERTKATYNPDNGYHEWKWTGWGLGTYTLIVTAEDTSGNTGNSQMDIWYFCFIP